MDLKNICLIISSIFGLISPVIAIRSILIGEFKPQRTTRTIFLIINLLFVTTLLAQGDKIGIALAIIQFTSSVFIFLLSIKFGVGGTNKSDIIVFICAIITLVIWKTTENPTLALYMSIITDIIAISPTIYKSFKQPFTEDPKFYASDTISAFLNLAAQRSYNLADIAYPSYIFLINGFNMLLIIIRRRLVQKKLSS